MYVCMSVCELFASYYQQANLRDLDNMYRENQWKDRLRHHKQIRLIKKDLKQCHSTFFLGSSYCNDSYVPSNLKWFSNHHPTMLGVVVFPIVSQLACLFSTTLWFWDYMDLTMLLRSSGASFWFLVCTCKFRYSHILAGFFTNVAGVWITAKTSIGFLCQTYDTLTFSSRWPYSSSFFFPILRTTSMLYSGVVVTWILVHNIASSRTRH